MSRNIQILFLSIIILASACKSTKDIAASKNVEVLPYETVAEKFEAQNHNYSSASIRAKIDVTEKKTRSFTANIRMVRDSIIWASLTGALGVEGARIIATKDSIHIIDKLNKIYYQKPFNYINEFVPFPLDLNFLQDILLGNHQLDTAAKTSFSIDDAYIIQQETAKMKSAYNVAPEFFYPLLVKLNELQSNRQVTIRYNDYRPANDTDTASKAFSFHRIVDFKSGKKTKIDIKFSRISWDEELSFPFSVGEKYEIRF
jgi:hypothetical protein